MNINELGGGQPHRIPSSPHFNNASRPDKEDKVSNAAGSQDDSVKIVRNSEVSQLVKQLDNNSEIRSDLVDLVKQKVESGEYFTRESAENLAAEILNLIR